METTKFKIIARGGPLNDHDPNAEREMEVETDELSDMYVAIPGTSVSGPELMDPPEDPPPGIKLYRRTGGGSVYTWG
jgi:hypothetical protein